jgi:hypothetical protein
MKGNGWNSENEICQSWPLVRYIRAREIEKQKSEPKLGGEWEEKKAIYQNDTKTNEILTRIVA